jgi:hypothetical protein
MTPAQYRKNAEDLAGEEPAQQGSLAQTGGAVAEARAGWRTEEKERQLMSPEASNRIAAVWMIGAFTVLWGGLVVVAVYWLISAQ